MAEVEIQLRGDFETTKRRARDSRSPEQIVAHYRLERRLSDRLRTAPPETRGKVYSIVYAELFNTLPDHPQNSAPAHTGRAEREASLLRGFLTKGATYLELGCGDALVTFEIAGQVATAYGLDVTDALIRRDEAPPNFQYLQTNGIDIPLPAASVDFVYSNQLMEHLHPDDAQAQLREVCRVLKPNGKYLCQTPSRMTGPHDVSVFFDYEATGFHLKEYDYRSLRKLGLAAGFRRIDYHFLLKGRRLAMPFWFGSAFERLLTATPKRWRARLTNLKPIYTAMGINAVMTR